MPYKKAISDFSKAKIAVIGDVMLDRYVYGQVERISPEAPVPVLKVNREMYEPGGAANVASNIASLGGNVLLLGYVGKDENASRLKKVLTEKKVDSHLIDILETTTSKERIIGKGSNYQQIVRIDREETVHARRKKEKEILDEIVKYSPQAIIASDYAKGVLSTRLMYAIKAYANANNIKLLVDPKPENVKNYSGVYLITPNTKEAKEISNESSIENAGKKIQASLNTNVIITRGPEGMTIFEKGKKDSVTVPTYAKEVFDVTGAGDTVIATLALASCSGLNLEQSAILANHAAGIKVGKAGTATVYPLELENALELENSKIKSLEELILTRDDLKRKNKRVVWTNGCFNLLHPGHVRYLKDAKRQGDVLIVGLNGDESVKRIKGDAKLILPEEQRAEIIASLEFVDYVTIFQEDTPISTIAKIRPDIYVKGGDYNIDSINQDERKLIESNGGKIVIIPVEVNTSTTEIINRIKGKK